MATRTRRQAGAQVTPTGARARKTTNAKSPKAAAVHEREARGAPSPSDTLRMAAAGARQPKRTLTPDNFLETVTNLVTSLPVLLPAFVSPSTSAALREKVFLGVTSINECPLL